MVPTFADVQAAAERIAPHAIRTPLVESWQLNAFAGGRVFLKLETLQRTGSFKFRGACNRLAMIPAKRARERRGGFFIGQSRAGRGGRGCALWHAGPDRHAKRRAAPQDRRHARLRRNHR